MFSQSYEPSVTYTFFGKEIFCKKVKKKNSLKYFTIKYFK